MATNSGRNEGGRMCGGKDRTSPDLLLIARGHSADTRKLYYTHTQTQSLHLPSGKKSNRHVRGTVDSGSVSRRGTMTTNHSL